MYFPSTGSSRTDTLIYPVRGDIAVHIIGQRYYVGDSWRWPLLVAKPLVAPDGTNIAFTDSIPLIAVPMKIFRAFLPPGFHSIFLWLALCWIVQPLAVVFALRSTGERRLLPSIAAAIFGVSVPTFIARAGHSALCSHFLILLAIGLYFYIVRKPQVATIISGRHSDAFSTSGEPLHYVYGDRGPVCGASYIIDQEGEGLDSSRPSVLLRRSELRGASLSCLAMARLCQCRGSVISR